MEVSLLGPESEPESEALTPEDETRVPQVVSPDFVPDRRKPDRADHVSEFDSRVDEETKPSFEEAGSQPFVYEARGKRMEMAYWLAPDGSLADSESLLPWAELGLAAAKRVKAKRPKKKGKKTG